MRRLEGARQKIAAQLLLESDSCCNHLKVIYFKLIFIDIRHY